MAKTLEKIIKENIDVSRIVRAIRAQGYKTSKERKAPVQSFAEGERFERFDDGWVRDLKTGLEWGPASTEEMDWKEAKAYAEKEGGRLPTREELQSIVDYTKRDPAIDTKAFTDTKSSWYWTSSPVAGGSRYAWCVTFLNGYVCNFLKSDSNYVRPVRSSQ